MFKEKMELFYKNHKSSILNERKACMQKSYSFFCSRLTKGVSLGSYFLVIFLLVLYSFKMGSFESFFVGAQQKCTGGGNCVSANTYKYDIAFNEVECMCVCFPGWIGDRCETPLAIPNVSNTVINLNYVSEYWSICNYAKNVSLGAETCRAFGNGWDLATSPTRQSAVAITTITNLVFGSDSNLGACLGGKTLDENEWKWMHGRIRGTTFFYLQGRMCERDFDCGWWYSQPDRFNCQGPQTGMRVYGNYYDDIQEFPATCQDVDHWFPQCLACERSPCNIPLECDANGTDTPGYYPNCCICKLNWGGNRCGTFFPNVSNPNSTQNNYYSEFGVTCQLADDYASAVKRCQYFRNGWDIATVPGAEAQSAISNAYYRVQKTTGALSLWISASVLSIESDKKWSWSSGRLNGTVFFNDNTCEKGMYCNWGTNEPSNMSCNGIKKTKSAISISTGEWASVYPSNNTCVSSTPPSKVPFCVVCERSLCNTKLDCNNSNTENVTGYYPDCKCNCKNGYLGKHCDDRLCEISLDCEKNSTINVTGIYPNCNCTCKPNKYGKKCEERSCDINKDCDKNNTLSVKGITPNCNCTCKHGYSGIRCQNRICNMSDCDPNRTISVSGFFPFCNCTCKPGFLGSRCQNRTCDMTDCDPNKTISVTGIFPLCNCSCNPGWVGSDCSHLAPPPPPPCSPTPDLIILLSWIFIGILTILSILLGATETIAQLQGLAALGHLPCGHLYFLYAFGSYRSLSLFALKNSYFGVLMGNVIVIIGVGVIQSLILIVLRVCFRTRRWEEIMSKIYFPAVVIHCTFALSCGTTFAASQVISRPDQKPLERLLGVIVLVCAIAYPVGVTFYAFKFITRAYLEFSIDDWLQKRNKFFFWKWIAPQGAIFSTEVRHSYGALISYRQRHLVWPSYQMWTPALFGLFGLIHLNSSISCAILLFGLAFLLAAITVVSIIFRPMCSTAGNILNIITRILLVIAVIIAAIGNALNKCVRAPIEYIGFLMAFIVFLRMIQMCFKRFYEASLINDRVVQRPVWEHNTSDMKEKMTFSEKASKMLDMECLNKMKDDENKDHDDESNEDVSVDEIYENDGDDETLEHSYLSLSVLSQSKRDNKLENFSLEDDDESDRGVRSVDSSEDDDNEDEDENEDDEEKKEEES